MKKFFIRKTHSDLVQEQNRLLETLLAKQEENPEKIIYKEVISTPIEDIPNSPASNNGMIPIEWTFTSDEDDEEVPYIPKLTESSAKLLSVNTNKVIFDEDGVEKLKKAKTNMGKVD